MEGFGDLKKTARIGMKGRWMQSIALCLLLWLPGLLTGTVEAALRFALHMPSFAQGRINSTIPSMVASFGCGLLCYLLWAPLASGVQRWHWRGFLGEQTPLRTAFFYFESYLSYLKAAGIWVCVTLRLLGWYLLLSIPGFAAGGLYLWRQFWQGSAPRLGALDGLFRLILLLWPLLALLLTCLVGQRYLLVNRLLAEQPQEPVRRILRRSVRLMRGYLAQAFLLRLSFALWYLPGVSALVCLTAGLSPLMPGMWLLPAAGVLWLVQCGLGFYLKPWKNAVMARYSGQILYGIGVLQDDENQTREYTAEIHGPFSTPISPELGIQGLP